jgi:hypothetical protein
MQKIKAKQEYANNNIRVYVGWQIDDTLLLKRHTSTYMKICNGEQNIWHYLISGYHGKETAVFEWTKSSKETLQMV